MIIDSQSKLVEDIINYIEEANKHNYSYNIMKMDLNKMIGYYTDEVEYYAREDAMRDSERFE